VRERDPSTSRMVDVGAKDISEREATAECVVRMSSASCERLVAGTPKGDPLEAARVAGLMAVKRTPDLLPFCHPVAVTSSEVTVEPRPTEGQVRIQAIVRARDRTGVEMESLTACAVAALSIYDTVKAFEPTAMIHGLVLVEKRGGKTGEFRAPGR
jgi:cyclic pyranopterin monophosphate synthase